MLVLYALTKNIQIPLNYIFYMRISTNNEPFWLIEISQKLYARDLEFLGKII